MDKEQKVAYEIVRQRIVDRLDKLEAAKKAGTKLPSGDAYSLKKWRRFGAAFAWDPSVYTAILQKPDMSDKALISELRKLEQTFMKKWGVIDKIPLHHKIASRTGGDLGIRTPVDVWLETRKRIFDATGAKPGNGRANLNAAGQFDELAHLGREGAKGSVFAKTGILRPEDFPYLHRAGQNLAEKAGADPKLVMGTAAEQAEALKPSIIQQLERFEETTTTPQVQAQRQVLTRAGYPEAFAPETSIERIQQINKEIRGTDIPQQFAEAFDFKNGSVGLNFQAPSVSESWKIIESRQQFPNRLIGSKAARFAPGIGVAAGLSAMGERARAGDFEGAAGEGIATAVGEVPIAGDILVTEAEGRAAGEGSAVPQGMTPQQYTQMQIEEAKNAKTFEQKVANELNWAAKNPAETVKNIAEAGLSTALSAGQSALDNPMLMPYTTPLKAIGGAMKLFGY